MKKYLIILAISLLIACSVNAQRDVNFGVNAGVAISGLSGSGAPDSYNKMFDFTGGLFLNTRISKFRSFMFELNYIRKSFNFTEDITLIKGGKLFVKEQNDFISFPAQFRIKKGDEYLNVFFSVGFEADFFIKNTRTGSASVDGFPVDYESFYNYDNNFYDYGFVAGIGVQYMAFSINLNGFISLRNMYYGEYLREMRYNTATLRLGYEINYKLGRERRKTSWRAIKYKIKHWFK